MRYKCSKARSIPRCTGLKTRASAAEWKESETGREAKFYRLTAKGRRQLKSETEDWHRLSAAVGLILRLSDGESS